MLEKQTGTVSHKFGADGFIRSDSGGYVYFAGAPQLHEGVQVRYLSRPTGRRSHVCFQADEIEVLEP